MARTISPFFLHLCKIHKGGRSNKLVDFYFIFIEKGYIFNKHKKSLEWFCNVKEGLCFQYSCGRSCIL